MTNTNTGFSMVNHVGITVSNLGLKSGFGTGVAYFTDPDGTNLELIAPKGPFQRG